MPVALRRCAFALLAAACTGAPTGVPVATRDAAPSGDSDLRPQFAAFGLPPRARSSATRSATHSSSP